MLNIPQRILILLLEYTLAFMIAVSLFFNITHLTDSNSYFGFLSLYNMFLDIDSSKWFSLEELQEFANSVTLPVALDPLDYNWLDALNLILNIIWVPTVYVTGFVVFLLSYVFNFVIALLQAFLGKYNITINNQNCMSCDIPLIL